MYNKMVVLSGLLVSIILGLMSSSFFIFWCMVELNSILFITILWMEKKVSSEMSMMKYFLIQGFGSLMLVWGIFIYLDTLILLGGLLKLGVFPFHLWSLDLVVNSSWLCWFMLMSMQKVLPMLMIMKVSGVTVLLSVLVLLNQALSCMGSIQKSSLKELMFYSSLFNMSLMLLLMNSMSLMFTFFMIYCLVLFPCWLKLEESGVEYVQQMKFYMGNMIPFLSLGGFPPSLGFIFKFSLFTVLGGMMSMYYCLILILLSLFMFYIYLNIMVLMKLNSTESMLMVGKNKVMSSVMFQMLVMNMML